tara:strand:- start:360 stop:1199 length:840 start_codon:yes stop_codon:yes gene_type:complete
MRVGRRCGLSEKRTATAMESLSESGKICLSEGLIDSTTTHAVLEETESARKSAKIAGKASAAKRKEKIEQNQSEISTPVDLPLNGSATAGQPSKIEDIEEELSKDSSKKAVKKRKRKIQADEQPSDNQKSDAQSNGMTDREFRFEWQRFRDHHMAKDSLMADWDAAWRTWRSNWQKFNGKIAPEPPSPPPPPIGPDGKPERMIPVGKSHWTESQCRDQIARWNKTRSGWPEGALGGPPGSRDCKIPEEFWPDRCRGSPPKPASEQSLDLETIFEKEAAE